MSDARRSLTRIWSTAALIIPSIRNFVIAIASLAISSATLCQVVGDEPETTRTVLILYSHQTNAPINADWDRGIRGALAAGFPEGVRIEIERLDLGREEDDEFESRLVDLLRHKYADRRIDVVIPVFTQALSFALDNRDLFQNAPVVFCSLPAAIAEQTDSFHNVTGVAFSWDLIETVELSRDLFPNTSRLFVVSGGHKWEMELQRSVEMKLSRYDDTLEIVYLTGLPLSRLCSELVNVDSQSIVLVLTHDGDHEGKSNTTVEAVAKISQHSSAPVFGLYDTPLGHGILGGQLASAEIQGKLAGELAVRIVRGESASEIPVAGLDSNRYMFDGRILSWLKSWRTGAHSSGRRNVIFPTLLWPTSQCHC